MYLIFPESFETCTCHLKKQDWYNLDLSDFFGPVQSEDLIKICIGKKIITNFIDRFFR
jgi:hypothetical protein